MPSAKTHAAKGGRPPAPTKEPAPTLEGTPAAPAVRPGMVSHTELASQDPPATRAWCERVLGWRFAAPVRLPEGDYHMWRHDTGTGGGIRGLAPQEAPGTTPYVEVPDVEAAVADARSAGGQVLLPPTDVPASGGRISVVVAPGGVALGLWAPR